MYCTASYCFSNVPIFKQLSQEDMDFIKSLIVREHYDKGALGVMTIAKNVLSNKVARKRVLEIRNTFMKYEKYLEGICVVATLKH